MTRLFLRYVVAAVIFSGVPVVPAQTPTHSQISGPSLQLHEAIAAAQRGDESAALALTQALLAQHPKFVPALKFQGALLEQLGHKAGSAASFAEALKFAPNDPELLLTVGINQLVAGDVEDAIHLFSLALKLLPKDGDTLYYLAQAYHLKGDNDLALKTIKRCLEAKPNEPSVWQKYGELLCSSKNYEAALTWLVKAQHADPTLDRIDFDLGTASFDNMNLTNAVEYSTKAVAAQPGNSLALALLAASDSKLGRWGDAEPVYAQILAQKPEDLTAMLGVGHCELELKDYAAAAASLERLLQLDPTEILAHFYLSRAYTAMGRAADAEHEAELHSRMMEQAAALASRKANDPMNATLEQVRQLLQAGQETKALQVAGNHASEPYATPGSPLLIVGSIYVSMDRPADAERCLRKALQIEPGIHGAHTYLGIVAMQAGNDEVAETEFKAELQSDPNYQLASAELGELRYRQARWSEAVDRLSKANGASPYFLYMLCDSYFHLGKVKEADLTAELIVDYGNSQPENLLRGTIDLLNRNHQAELAQRLSTKVNAPS